ncbi:MAG: hypothetical protein WCQ77_10140, partial [Planctomycetota bacterium]
NPTPPQSLNAFAREILDLLAGHPDADALIMASKMTALVEHGAPRDLRDIHELCRRGLISVETCWRLYGLKQPDQDAAVAADKVLFTIERLELQRPLTMIHDASAREEAGPLRQWYRQVFCPAARR